MSRKNGFYNIKVFENSGIGQQRLHHWIFTMNPFLSFKKSPRAENIQNDLNFFLDLLKKSLVERLWIVDPSSMYLRLFHRFCYCMFTGILRIKACNKSTQVFASLL